MIVFCARMGWGMLQAVLEHMSDRLKAGARADLLELARIPYVKSRTARVFWECGFRSLRAVAGAEARDLVPVLMQVRGFLFFFSLSHDLSFSFVALRLVFFGGVNTTEWDSAFTLFSSGI